MDKIRRKIRSTSVGGELDLVKIKKQSSESRISDRDDDSSWFVICVVTAHGPCARPALY